MLQSIEQTLLERRSIRRYQRLPVSAEDMEFIHEAIRNTPTSYNGQQYSVIDIDDQALKEELYALTGQKQIKTCSHFLVFCADYNKITLAALNKGVSTSFFPETVDGYTVGVIDASLALMSALTAAQSRGLGTCPIGYIRTANPEATVEKLGLPHGVFPVCGLAIGIPSELPDLKPKQPLPLLIHRNKYSTEGMKEALQAYDDEITAYNRNRAGGTSENDWVAHICGYYEEGCSGTLKTVLQQCGFLTASI